MNFSFASAPTTPFLAQTDGKGAGATVDTQLLSVGATAGPISAGVVATSRATDPLSDIGSPANVQYLQFTMGQSPFMVNGGMAAINSPSSVALNLPPKHRQSQQQSHLQHHPQPPHAQQQRQQQQQTQAPQIQIMPAAVSPSSAAAASTLALVSNGAGLPGTSLPGFSQTASTQALSPMMEDPLPGFSHPAQVFRTPENRMLPDISTQATPVLALFDDADAIGGMRVLSPRTQTAQAGLSLLAASATYAQNSSSDMLGVTNAPVSAGAAPVVSMGGSRSPMVAETPFLNARGENATLMSQPQNSLTNHFSPPMVDRMGLQQQHQPLLNGMGHSLTTGRLVRNRSLLRQSSGLTSASFHNDLVPQANESFFAPLDEVCSETGSQQQQQQQQQTLANRQQQSAGAMAPRMGSQFSPVMGMSGHRFSQHLQPTLPPPPQRHRPWLSPNPSEPPSYHQNHHSVQRPAQQQPLPGSSSQYAVGSPMGPPSTVPYASNPSGALPHRQNAKATPGAIFSQMPSLNNNSSSSNNNNGNISRPGARDGSWRAGSAHGSSDSQASDATSITIDDEEMHSSGEMGSSKRRRTGGEGKTRHKRDQERRFDCDVCHRSFARQYNLKTHRLTHFPNAQASRPFKCAFCPKAFTRKHDLQRHSVLHERKDKHTCAWCNRGFPRKDALKKHMETESCNPPV